LTVFDLVNRLATLCANQRVELERLHQQIDGWRVFSNGALQRWQDSEAEASSVSQILVTDLLRNMEV